MSEHQEHLERVSQRIAAAIMEFWAKSKTFHADDLRAHVLRTCGTVAPGSPDRILRDLRKRKLLNYKVLSRRESLYEVQPVAIREEQPELI